MAIAGRGKTVINKEHRSVGLRGQRLAGMSGDRVRDRIARATAERKAKGTVWRGTPSDDFDWDGAIARFRIMMKEMYDE